VTLLVVKCISLETKNCAHERLLEDKTQTRATFSSSGFCILACLVLSGARALAQAPVNSVPSPHSDERSDPVERGIDLATEGHCEQALPLLKKFTASIQDKQLKYRALKAMVRCSMKEQDDRATANALFDMRHDFPEDPEVLYMTSQFFLGVAEGASQELTMVAPDSYQTRELKAETLESQEKWAEAADIYRKILEENPKLRGIHYRLGRAALSQRDSPTRTQEAKKEFEQELAIDPMNAAAVFWLGEIARLDSQWEEAISHFAAAARIDPHFADAFLSWGAALNSVGRYTEAIPPLEQYVRMAPQNLSGHYRLSIAYARTGRTEDSAREAALHQQLIEKGQAAVKARATATPH
jgi:tetratricopeptide (TPR) repeat protein